MDEVADGSSTRRPMDRRRVVRWLRVSIAANMILAGAVVGLVASQLLGGPPLMMPPPDGGALQTVFTRVLDEVVEADNREEALAIVARHRRAFDETVRTVAGDGDWLADRRERMSQAFVDGDLTDAMVEEWRATLTQVGDARWRFISSVFLDLSQVLDRDERARLRDAMAARARQLRACVE